MKHLVYILFLFAAVACSTTPSSSGLKTITLREVQSKPGGISKYPADLLEEHDIPDLDAEDNPVLIRYTFDR